MMKASTTTSSCSSRCHRDWSFKRDIDASKAASAATVRSVRSTTAKKHDDSLSFAAICSEKDEAIAWIPLPARPITAWRRLDDFIGRVGRGGRWGGYFDRRCISANECVALCNAMQYSAVQ